MFSNMYFIYINYTFVLLFLMIGKMPALAGNHDTKEDTLIIMEGKVFDKISNIPINATIFYEKLPYGNDLGIIHTKDSGNYEFYLFPNSNYKIHVKAKDYLAVVENIFPTPCQNQGIVKQNFYLRPIKLGELITLQNLIFNQGDFTIQKSCYSELDQLVLMLNEHCNMEIQLEGHTDYRGNKKLNYKLSLQRVNMVKEYLVAQGIKKDRVKTRAFGGESPMSRENSEEARKMNRRVEIRILRI
jgi:OmpA-OmpF porin, OOP family